MIQNIQDEAIIIIIIKNGWQRKTGRELLTPYQSEEETQY